MSDKILKNLILGDDIANSLGGFNFGDLGFSLADFNAESDEKYNKKNKTKSTEKKQKQKKIKFLRKNRRLGKKKISSIPNEDQKIQDAQIAGIRYNKDSSHLNNFSREMIGKEGAAFSASEKNQENLLAKNLNELKHQNQNSLGNFKANNSENFNTSSANNFPIDKKFEKIINEKDLDLKLLCINDGEKIYKLSDLFIPKDEKLIRKIERYNNRYMSISEKEKYEKENEGKKEVSETDEIKQVIRKAKRNQKFTKINITFDEKFFDRTHFLDGIHASTLAHQENVIKENKEFMKRQIMKEGLLKSYEILPERKIDSELVEKNLLNSLFNVKVNLEKFNFGNYAKSLKEFKALVDSRNLENKDKEKKEFENDEEKMDLEENENEIRNKNVEKEQKNEAINMKIKSNQRKKNKENFLSDIGDYILIKKKENKSFNNFLPDDLESNNPKDKNYNKDKNLTDSYSIIDNKKKENLTVSNFASGLPNDDLSEYDKVINLDSPKKKIKKKSIDEEEDYDINKIDYNQEINSKDLNHYNPEFFELAEKKEKEKLPEVNIEHEEIKKLNSIICENMKKNFNLNFDDLKSSRYNEDESKLYNNYNYEFQEEYPKDLNFKEQKEVNQKIGDNMLENISDSKKNNQKEIFKNYYSGFDENLNVNNEINFYEIHDNDNNNSNMDFDSNFNSQKNNYSEKKEKEENPSIINDKNSNKIQKRNKDSNLIKEKENENEEFKYKQSSYDELDQISEEQNDNETIMVKDLFETKEFKIFDLENSELLKKAIEPEKSFNEEDYISEAPENNESITKENFNFNTVSNNFENNLNNLNNKFNLNTISDKNSNKKFDFEFNKPIPNTNKERNHLTNSSSDANYLQMMNYKNPNNESNSNLNEINENLKKSIMPLKDLKENEYELKEKEKEKKIFVGLKRQRALADSYDLFNKSKYLKNKQQGYYNENLLTGDYLNGVLLNEGDLNTNKHKFFDISKKIFDHNDYNMNFEILKVDNNNKNNKEKEKEQVNPNLASTAERKESLKENINLNQIQIDLADINENGITNLANINNMNLGLNEENNNKSNNNKENINQIPSESDFFNNLNTKLNFNSNLNNQNFLKIGKAKGNILTHAKCSYNLTYNKINLHYDDLRDFHRPNFCKYLLREKKKKNFRVSFSSNNFNLPFGGDRNKSWDATILTRSFLKKQEKKRISKNIQYMNAYEIFKDRQKLSLNDGKFSLFEHIDEYPLFISNFGMASKLKKFVYTPKLFNVNVTNPNTKLNDVEMKTYNITGPYGIQILLQNIHRLPLVGQIDQNELKGISIIDNKMYRCPVFYEKIKNPQNIQLKADKNNINNDNDNENKSNKINNHDQEKSNDNNNIQNASKNTSNVNSRGRKRNVLGIHNTKINNNNNEINSNKNNNKISLDLHELTTDDNNINNNENNENDNDLNKNQNSNPNIQIIEKDGKKYYNFLLTFRKSKEGKENYLIRELEHNYVVAQEEPKIEVYPPQSRQYNTFLKKKIQTYTYKLYDEIGYKRGINFKEFTNLFPNVTEQILKKNFKEMNIEIDKNICFFSKIPSEDNHMLITPENICQFESCQFGIFKLREVGIKNLTNPDKISYATNKFINQTPDQKQQFLAKVAEEELLTTPWNVTQNYLQAKQIKGMLAIKGIGDPSNGQGGYSFLKMPVKTYNDNKTLKEEIDILKNANKNIKTVTGTDADLRKLSKEDIKMKLISLGQDEEIINKLSRWERVSLLRYRSSQAAQMGYEGDITKYARGTRMNSKIQRDTYQKNINEVFKKQIQYITCENPDNFVSDSESSDCENLFETSYYNQNMELDEEDPKKGLNFMKNEIYSNPNNKKKKRAEAKRNSNSNEQPAKKQPEEKIIKLYKKNSDNIPIGGDANTKIKFDMKNIDINLLQRKRSRGSHLGDIYEYDDRTTNLFSRKRRDTPQKSFNDIMEDIVDNCVKFDTTKLFHNAVKKKDYKDYYELIKNPIDLSSMKNKTKRCEYNFLQQFKDDLDLMVENSKIYNGEEHVVTVQGNKVRTYALGKIEENMEKIREVENKMNPNNDNEE